MLSKAKIKFIKSLQIKKYRKQEQSFVVQGAKSVQELLNSDFETLMVVGTSDYEERLDLKRDVEYVVASEKDLAALGEFQTNDAVLAVARTKPNTPASRPEAFTLLLDDIRDPGNLGTILRTADWYGINSIIASPETADLYNPKVISATMGSFTRIHVYYENLETILSNKTGRVFGAYLKGNDVHKERFEGGGMVIIGNESRGIAPQFEKYITDKITIPRFGGAESLNAAIATAIICDNIRRNNPK
jgi:TrmH family RNA methyltransferase